MDLIVLITALIMGLLIILYKKSYSIRRVYGAVIEHSEFARAHQVRDYGLRIFFSGLTIRLFGLAVLLASDAIQKGISRDSLKYHHIGMDISRQMAAGFFNWPNWIDNGWFQFTGLIYYLFGTQMILIQLLNVMLGSATGVLVYRLSREVYGYESLSRFAGYVTAFFPSFIYYSILPLKDTLSLFALLFLVIALVRLRERFSPIHMFQIAFMLVVVLGLRDYLFLVCLGLVLLSMVPVSKRRVSRFVILLIGLFIFLGGITYAFGMGFFSIEVFRSAKYFDLEYINYTRQAMNRGYGSFYDTQGISQWGQGIYSDLRNVLTSVYYFFFSIDPTEVGRARQMFALPEMLFLLVGFPALIHGVLLTWREQRHKALPVLIFAFGIMAVYGSATTNMGAMFRWRMQALPFFLLMLCYGVYRRRKGVLYNLMWSIGRNRTCS